VNGRNASRGRGFSSSEASRERRADRAIARFERGSITSAQLGAILSELEGERRVAALCAEPTTLSSRPTVLAPPAPISLVPLRLPQPLPPSDDVPTVVPPAFPEGAAS
jgi:hypothetical protein